MTLSLRSLLVLALPVVLLGGLLGGCATTSQTPAMSLEQQVEQQVATQAPGATRIGPMFSGNGPKMDYAVQLERGSCYWFSGVTDDAGEKLSLYLWGPPYSRRLTDARSSTASATMGHCPVVSGMYHFQAKTRRDGAFVVGLYAKAAQDGSTRAAYAQPANSNDCCDEGSVGAVVPGYGAHGVTTQPTECRMGSDGMSSCGYDCKLGSNGHFYCSSVPGGHCALNSDGTWSCP